MVLRFSTIVPCLQGKIAEKMSYFDLEQLDMSSRKGRKVVGYVSIMPTVSTTRIWFGGMMRNGFIYQSGEIHLHRPGDPVRIEKEFASLSDYKHLPRFLIEDVQVRKEATSECISHPIIKDRRRFIYSEVRLDWRCQSSDKGEIMQKMTEMFDIVEISIRYSLDDIEFFSLPVFNRVSKFFSSETIPDNLLLSLTAPTISIGTPDSFPHMGPTLRTFFTQYFNNERELGSFNMVLVNVDEAIDYNELFKGLEYFKLIWSLETHDSSAYAHVPKDHLPDTPDVRFYLIRGGMKKLIVFVADFMMRVNPTFDERKDVLLFIDNPPESKRLKSMLDSREV